MIFLVAIVLCWSYLRSLELMKNQVNILNFKLLLTHNREYWNAVSSVCRRRRRRTE